MSVLFETSLGDIVIDLETDLCPKTCENFLKLCKVYYYNLNAFFNGMFLLSFASVSFSSSALFQSQKISWLKLVTQRQREPEENASGPTLPLHLQQSHRTTRLHLATLLQKYAPNSSM